MERIPHRRQPAVVGFDIFCAFQDVYLMSFMFFMSGLFVWPSLRRKGSTVFRMIASCGSAYRSSWWCIC
jgi:hypothetical protein